MRRGSRRVRAAAAGLGVVVLGGGLVLAGASGGYPAVRPQLLSGAAWLASSQVGQLTLLDGSSAEVAAQVQVAAAGEHLDVVQQGATAYAVNRSTGTLRRVDGATFTASPPATPIPDAGDGLRAFAGTDSLYALDARRGVLTATDPNSLTDLGTPVPLATEVSPDGAALDDAGRLWVLDTPTGDLVWIDHGQRHTRRGAARPGAGQLVLSDGAPVIVDGAARTATRLDPGSGAARTTVGLDLRPGDQVAVSGSPHSPRLYLALARGLLDICDLTATTCASAVPLGTAGAADLGSPVETGGRLFVPDYASGRVWIVDLRESRIVAQPKVLDPKTRFQLLTRDGVVFFNDPDSEHAGVLRLDGGVRRIAKYDPKDPKKGLSATSSPSPSPNPGPPESPTQPQQPPVQTPSSPTGTPPTRPRAPFVVAISVSTATAPVGVDVTLKVTAVSGGPPTGARWTFGDGQGATGLLTAHHWGVAQTYQVAVKATGPGGQSATASLPITVVTVAPKPVTVPDVVSKPVAVASQTLTAVGLVPTAVKRASNTVPAGSIIAQNPAGGATAMPGDPVTLTVSSGKTPPFSLISHAAQATWRSGAGALPFPGSETDARGFAIIRPANSLLLEDGSSPQFLETHPQWVENNQGWINGDFTLPTPIAAGDHFRATVGFIAVANPPSAGDAEFVVVAVFPNGAVKELSRTHDIGRDGVLVGIDDDLSSAVGATKIRLRVEAGASSAQDWASWVAPRVEG